MKYCNFCGAELDDSVKFCVLCGHEVKSVEPEKPAVPICSKCGKELQPDAAFCIYCGTPINVIVEDTLPVNTPEQQVETEPEVEPEEAYYNPELTVVDSSAYTTEVYQSYENVGQPVIPMESAGQYDYVSAQSQPAAAHCTNCGKELNPGAAFCVYCGARVGETAVKYPVSYNEPTSVVPADGKSITPEYNASYPAAEGGLRTNRTLAKYFFLSLVTFGIYGLVVMIKLSNEINIVAERYDGKHTMNYALVYFLFSWLTCGILPLIWYHKFSNRIAVELQRRNINYGFSAKYFWLWGILGSAIVCGPFIYYHKLLTAMNLLNGNYNVKGC